MHLKASPTLTFYHAKAATLEKESICFDTYDVGDAEDSWVLPTYLALRDSGFDVTLSDDPNQGEIVFISSYSIDSSAIEKEKFVVCLLADGFPSRRADLTVVQNWEQAAFCEPAICLPHWPQPGIQPRDGSRGETLQNVAYFGAAVNLHPELREPAFKRRLREELGIDLVFPAQDRWADYSEVDVTIAIRPPKGGCWDGAKPSSKLINSWIAGVPAIVGPESSVFASGQPGRDYLLADNAETVFQMLRRLKSGPGEFSQLIEQAKQNADRFSIDAFKEQWRALLQEVVIPMTESEMGIKRCHWLVGWINHAMYRLKRRRTL